MSTVALLVAVVALVPGAATAMHLAVLAAASVWYRAPTPPPSIPPVRFLVLVPAHDEELVIGATLRCLTADLRPTDGVLVVADRCTDATAAIARACGALVLERGPDAPPGRAAARQAGLEHALGLAWDAIVMIDADSIIQPGFFAACEAALASGAPALQARSEIVPGPRLVDQAAVAAFALQGVTMPRGRDRLGLLVRLRGTGMVLRRDVAARCRFRAPASEDLWCSLDLCLEGVRPRHVETARVHSLNVSSWHDAATQRVRYEAGRLSAARAFVGPLLRHRGAAAFEAAWFLCTPPYAVAALLLVVAAGVAAAAGAAALAAAALALLAVLGVGLAVALVQAGVGARTWCALAIAPWYLPWKAVVQLRALVSVRRRVTLYAATPRG
jgi:cellulose synthase/poly-beta-1,6-N-acetylglucosamine synthase-like glycosyltransferase